MEEKNYGKERRDRASFGSKKRSESKPDGKNPRFKRDSESREDNKEGRSEFPRKRRESSNKPYQRDDSRSRSPRKFDDSDRRTNRSEDSRTRSPRRNDDDFSERSSDRRRHRSDDSRSRSPRREDDGFSNRRHRSDNANPRFRKDSDSRDRRRKYSEESDANQEKNKKPVDRFANKPDRKTLQSKHYSKKKQLAHAKISGPEDGILRLNKFIANTGVCSRREADNRIAEGRITVNGRIVTEVGTKVHLSDEVCLDGKKLQAEAKVYLVLNKPKDFVTTLDDPMGRKTVIDLIKNACDERVYPVGRLDRMTTGILLFTNDGDLTKRLTHPSYNKKKIYHVFLDREISQVELDQVSAGLQLEDGEIKADAISFADPKDKTQVGIEIHSGRNRIVRRIFEHLGYEVEKLDRVFFAGITKKNLPRGKWRFLSEKEVQMLKIYS